MNQFNNLNLREEILRSLREIGFDSPTPIQQQIIPHILEKKRDIIGLAGTGTGKTAAFGLPILQNLDTTDRRTHVLILAPTRELTIQIASDLKQFAKYMPEVRIGMAYGGAPIEKQIRDLQRGAHIVVATPGRLIDLMRRNRIDISAIQTLVLDEADEMLNFGFKEELDIILEVTPKEKTTLLLSATMSAGVSKIAHTYMDRPLEIQAEKAERSEQNIEHRYYVVNGKDRYHAIKRTVELNPDIYAIVFCRTRQESKDIAERLIQDGFAADALHGELSQAQRDQVMKRFKEKSVNILVATDVASRGIDVKNITHVIHYSLPDESEVYTHRSGRTGRAGNQGISISLVHAREMHRLERLSGYLNQAFTYHRVPGKDEITQKRLESFLSSMHHTVESRAVPEETLNQALHNLADLSKEELIEKLLASHVVLDQRSGDFHDLNMSFSEKATNGEKRGGGEHSRKSQQQRRQSHGKKHTKQAHSGSRGEGRSRKPNRSGKYQATGSRHS